MTTDMPIRPEEHIDNPKDVSPRERDLKTRPARVICKPGAEMPCSTQTTWTPANTTEGFEGRSMPGESWLLILKQVCPRAT